MKKIFLLYPYYWPHYKAGGPVQSLFNLVALFKDRAEFYVVSNQRDIDGERSSISIVLNAWNKGPNGENIFYMPSVSPLKVFSLLKQVSPDVVFINGLFNLETTLTGILAARFLKFKLIVSPRGMLQAWGLKRGALKKRIVLNTYRWFLKSNAQWHATDQQEKEDIIFHFGDGRKIFVALNIPKQVKGATALPWANDMKVRLVFLSLINSNKNLHLVIEAVNELKDFVSLDIYGPVIDGGYWDKCKALMRGNSSICYHGPVPAWEAADTLSRFHLMVLPTQGENFGHAIFDALSVGVPVLISRNTPWKNIEAEGAGYYIGVDNAESLVSKLNALKTVSPDQYATMQQNALLYARKYWNSVNYNRDYEFLFN